MDLQGNLLLLATTYAETKNWKLSTLGVRIRCDQRFFEKVSRGVFRVGVYAPTVAWFWDNWPDDVAWPKHIEHPKGGKKDAVDARNGRRGQADVRRRTQRKRDRKRTGSKP
jgi:hypothetical protein